MTEHVTHAATVATAAGYVAAIPLAPLLGAIILGIYQNFESIDVEAAHSLRH